MLGKSQFKKRLEENWSRLYRMAYAWSHDVHISHDLVQETISKALAKRHQLKQQQAFDAWIFKILSNCWYDFCRYNKNITDMSGVSEQEYNITPEMDQDSRETIQIVRHALAQLSANQRQVVTLVDLEEMTYSEVSEILDVPIGTVMSRLCRARNKLKEILEKMDRENNLQVGNVWRIK